MIKTLRQMVETLRDAFREEPTADVSTGEVSNMLDSILSDTEPGEWRGPWQCNKCSKIWEMKVTAHYPDWKSFHEELCNGTLVPYERRHT